MSRFIPLENFTARIAPLDAPYSDSIVFDPDLLAQYASEPDTKPDTRGKEPTYDYPLFIAQRSKVKAPRILYYRQEAQRIYGRVLLAVLQALMIGRIRFKAKPSDEYSELASETYTRIYMKYIHPLITSAIQDYFITGLGGISISPLGIHTLRPENTSAFPSFFQPRFTIRAFAMDWEDAKQVFNHPALKKEPTPIGATEEEIRHYKTTRNAMPLKLMPTVILLEIMKPNQIEYYYGVTQIGTIQRKNSWGHYLLIGDPRTIDIRLPNALITQPDPDDTHETSWVSERADDYNELPVGLIELLTSNPYRGYNLLEAHEKLVEGILVAATRTNVCGVRADLLNLADPNTRAFLDYYKPIATMGGESAAAAIAFIDRVSIAELQAGLREIENQITAITGITPYMMGLTGVSDVASEIVMMQSQANARINHIHSIITTWLGELIEKTTQYLTTIPPESQTPLSAYNPHTKERIIVGGIQDPTSPIPQITYADLFSRYHRTHTHRRTHQYQPTHRTHASTPTHHANPTHPRTNGRNLRHQTTRRPHPTNLQYRPR